MRTTVDLPPALHRRVTVMARDRGQSVSSVLAELTARGLASLEEPLSIAVDEATGFPSFSVGRPLTSEMVAALLDDE